MKTLTVIATLLFSCLLCHNDSAAQDFEWQTEEYIRGIELATATDSEGASWVKVSTVVSAHYWSLLNLLRDTDVATQWVDNAIQIELIRRPDYRTDIVYTLMHAPWPFANREMYTLSVITFEPDLQTLTIVVEQTDEYSGNHKHVTMEQVKGTWYAQQLNEEETRITWLGTGLAGGSIPDWLAISELQSSTFKTFENLRNKITATKYQEKPLAYRIYAEKSQLAGEER